MENSPSRMRLHVHRMSLISLVAATLLALGGCFGGTWKKRAEEEEDKKQRWMAMTMVVSAFGVSCTVLALFVGAGLGSRARRDAKKIRDEEQQ